MESVYDVTPEEWCEALQKNQFMRRLCRIIAHDELSSTMRKWKCMRILWGGEPSNESWLRILWGATILMRFDCYEIWMPLAEKPAWLWDSQPRMATMLTKINFKQPLTQMHSNGLGHICQAGSAPVAWQNQMTLLVWFDWTRYCQPWPVHYREAFWCEEAQEWATIMLTYLKSSNYSSCSILPKSTSKPPDLQLDRLLKGRDASQIAPVIPVSNWFKWNNVSH